jgi:hypothetical protein
MPPTADDDASPNVHVYEPGSEALATLTYSAWICCEEVTSERMSVQPDGAVIVGFVRTLSTARRTSFVVMPEGVVIVREVTGVLAAELAER